MEFIKTRVLGLVLVSVCLLFSSNQPVHAVEKTNLKGNLDGKYLRDYAETRAFALGRPAKAKPSPDGKSVLFLRAQARVAKQGLYIFDVATGQTKQLLTPEEVLKGAEEHLSAEEKARRERQRISVGGFTDFQLSDDSNLILVSLSGKLYVVNRASGKITPLNTGTGDVLDPKFSPDSKKVSYVQNNDLFVWNLDAGRAEQITTGGTDIVTHGLAEFVAQEEMDRFTGYWWSPDSNSIVYEEVDHKGVEVWYISDPQHPETKPTPAFYPRPGKDNVKPRLAIIAADKSGNEPRFVEWDTEKFPYLATVVWPKKGPLSMLLLSRKQQDAQLMEIDPATGKTKLILSEHDDKFLNLQKGMPLWLENGNQFLWVTERTGAKQLELRERNGALSRIRVEPEFMLSDVLDVDGDGNVFFLASKDPAELQLYSVSLNNNEEPKRITRDRGVHGASFAKNHEIYVHDYNSVDIPPRASVHTADGKQIGVIPAVAEDPPVNPHVEFVELDGPHKFRAYLVRPQDFDPKKRYPVIVDVYGGPHKIKVQAFQRNFLLDQWLADQGFVVACVDGRGTPGRGRDWERDIYLHFGSVPLEDQVEGVQQLCKKYPEMDPDRIGITGWSFGGYMSALAVLRRPDVYKVAVAGAPVVAWEDYDTCYTERYLGLPQENPEAYKEGSLLTYARDLKRPLLLVHGTSDDNVFFCHSLKLADELFKNGKQFDILPLSGLTHMVSDPVAMENLWSRIIAQFKTHLGEPQ